MSMSGPRDSFDATPRRTQRPHSPTPTPSPTASSITTPPSSLRKYASEMRASLAKGMSTAMADMKDDARQAERQFDQEFGYADEDPIERYVKLHMPRRKSVMAPADVAALAARISSIPGLPPVSQLSAMGLGIHVDDVDAGIREGPSPEPTAPADQFRPGLIQFHRTQSGQSSRRGIPSFGHCTDEGTSTSADSSPFGNGMDTPGSQWSEASFEAIKPEDVLSLYGSSVESESACDLTNAPVSTGRPLSARYADPRSSILSSMSTITSLSTITSASDATIATAVKVARPTLGRRRSRTTADPYPGDGESRAKERDLAGEAGKLGVPNDDEDEWLSGRTISEQMIAQAGIRCQRGRAGVRR